MNIIDKLLELGFELSEWNGEQAYIKSSSGGNRRTHYYVYYEDENMFYIHAYFARGIETIDEDRLLENHNNLNTAAKEMWLNIKAELKDYAYLIY